MYKNLFRAPRRPSIKARGPRRDGGVVILRRGVTGCSNTAGRDGSAPRSGKLFFREPKALSPAEPGAQTISQVAGKNQGDGGDRTTRQRGLHRTMLFIFL